MLHRPEPEQNDEDSEAEEATEDDPAVLFSPPEPPAEDETPEEEENDPKSMSPDEETDDTSVPEEETGPIDPLKDEKDSIKQQCEHAELIAEHLEEQMEKNKQHICTHQKNRMHIKMKQAHNHFMTILNKKMKEKEKKYNEMLTKKDGVYRQLLLDNLSAKQEVVDKMARQQVGKGENKMIKSLLLLAAASTLSGCKALEPTGLEKMNLKQDLSQKKEKKMPNKVNIFKHCGQEFNKQSEKYHHEIEKSIQN